MLSINYGKVDEVIEAFLTGCYKSAIFPMKNIRLAQSEIMSLVGWDVSLKDLSATKDGKYLKFVLNKEDVYGRNFDYLGVCGFIPDTEDFLYYMTRLREVK